MGQSTFISNRANRVAAFAVAIGLSACQGGHLDPAAGITAAGITAAGATAARATAKRHPVRYRPRPSGVGSGIATDLVDHNGAPIKAPCGSCHAGKAPSTRRRSGETLKIFHSGLRMKHGTLSCLTCHNGNNYDTLRLADDTEVQFDALMTLCGQCHGPQKRDYDHGSHGGMTGFWDLTKGPRVRNQCVHCHDPHAPAYVGMVPAAGPRDRFLQPARPGHGH